jgi:hypothetical protein
MSISSKQKKIIEISRKLINKNKKINSHRVSSLTYFALWGDSPGFARVKYEIYGFKKIFNYWFKILKDIASIAFLNNYQILKNKNFNPKNFKRLLVSRSIIEDFDRKGNYKDRYFLINSNNKKDTLFVLINSGIRVPKKIGKNVVIIYQKKKALDLLFFFKYSISKIISSNYSVKNFFYNTSSSSVTGEFIINFFKKEINFNKIKSILVPYEGQPYEHLIFEELRKKNKKLLIGGYDHSAPHSIPTHLLYRSFSPDFLYVNGISQINFSKKFLNWPIKKLKLAPSLRYPKKLKLDFNNIVFLPYDIFNEKVVVEEFKKNILDNKNFDLKSLKIKNHPMMFNSKKHLNLKFKLEKMIQENKKKVKKVKKQNIAIFIGATTGVIVALEKKINVIHICFDSVFDSYNQTLWPNLIVKQVSKNTFTYKLKKYNTFLKFNNSQNCYKKYYEI